MKNSKWALYLSSSVVLCALIFAFTVNKVFFKQKQFKNNVYVTGSTSHDFTSDIIVWEANFSRLNIDIKEAYNLMKEDRKMVEYFLLENGIEKNEIVFSSINWNEEYYYKYNEDGKLIKKEFKGYNLTQKVRIDSRKVDLVENVSNEITNLIENGVLIDSYSPEYYYSKLDELKIAMLKEAAQNAHLRAKTVVENSTGRLGDLVYTNVGVFQIIGKNSNESYSWGGSYNTSSKLKTANVTVKQEYQIR